LLGCGIIIFLNELLKKRKAGQQEEGYYKIVHNLIKVLENRFYDLNQPFFTNIRNLVQEKKGDLLRNGHN